MNWPSGMRHRKDIAAHTASGYDPDEYNRLYSLHREAGANLRQALSAAQQDMLKFVEMEKDRDPIAWYLYVYA